MINIPQEVVDSYRSITFRTCPSMQLQNIEQAIEFVNTRGFIFFWPITDIPFPSLWAAKAGNRPIADNHDDPDHITWQWKDDLLGKQKWYYGKILRKKATIICLNVAPYFYALPENFGSPEEDYLTLYEQGRLSQEAKMIYKVLLEKGALDTIALRKEAHLSAPENESRFNKALTDLQSDFKIAPVGVSQAGSWKYSHIYDITPRAYPDLLNDSRFIDEETARKTLIKIYFTTMGVAKINQIQKLFQWHHTEINRSVQFLIQDGFLVPEISINNDGTNWLGITSMLE